MNSVIESLPPFEIYKATKRAMGNVYKVFEFQGSTRQLFLNNLKSLMNKKISSGFGTVPDRLKRLFRDLAKVCEAHGFAISSKDYQLLKFIIVDAYRPNPRLKKVIRVLNSDVSDETAERILSNHLPSTVFIFQSDTDTEKPLIISKFLRDNYYTKCFTSEPECSVCTDTIPLENFVLLPCGHYHCNSCTKRLKHCSICRSKIQ